jgi:hypothetical protein
MEYTEVARRLAELREQVLDPRIAADLEAVRVRVVRLADDVLLRRAIIPTGTNVPPGIMRKAMGNR